VEFRIGVVSFRLAVEHVILIKLSPVTILERTCLPTVEFKLAFGFLRMDLLLWDRLFTMVNRLFGG
jgi:hypothetical protein